MIRSTSGLSWTSDIVTRVPTPFWPDFELGRERIDHAELLVVAGVPADDGEDLAIHERRGGLGHLLRGVGRVAVLRGNRPQAVLLGHFELAERGRVFVEPHDPQPLGLVRRIEVLRQVLADQRLFIDLADEGREYTPTAMANSPMTTNVIVLAFSVIA